MTVEFNFKTHFPVDPDINPKRLDEITTALLLAAQQATPLGLSNVRVKDNLVVCQTDLPNIAGPFTNKELGIVAAQSFVIAWAGNFGIDPIEEITLNESDKKHVMDAVEYALDHEPQHARASDQLDHPGSYFALFIIEGANKTTPVISFCPTNPIPLTDMEKILLAPDNPSEIDLTLADYLSKYIE